MTPEQLKAEREAFEKWFRKERHSRLDRNMPDKSYNDPAAYEGWLVWQARAAHEASAAVPVGAVWVMADELTDWKNRVNTLATLSLKADRYSVGRALKQDIADAIACAPLASPPPPQHEAPKVRMWHDRIKEERPTIEPRYWPAVLKAEYMEAEILELRAALSAPPQQERTEARVPPDSAAVLKACVEALRELLNDTQHAEHDCGDEEHCPVLHAKTTLARAKALLGETK